MRLSQTTAGALVSILLVAGLSACGGDEPANGADPTPTSQPTSSATDSAEPSPSESPTPTPTPETNKDKASAALLAYLEVRDEMYRSLKIPKDLDKYATDSAYYSIQKEILAAQSFKDSYEGSWGHQVVDVRRDDQPGFVVADCEDLTDVDARLKNGDPIKIILPDGREQPVRTRINYRVLRDNGRWVVESVTTGNFPPC